ncbi:hypothetical protein GQ44DRAFT_724485 [Phaeosphaeriaceae sp. PMI808]|nr:hypothetical protein GQ44DRAFT_724485 [Phaeosphaeriaceae sp. PMI808]
MAMPSYPWLSVTNDDKSLTLWAHKTPFLDVLKHDNNPSFITFIGTYQKSQYLSSLIGYAKALQPHGQVRVNYGAFLDEIKQSILLDCEISSATSPGLLQDQARGIPRIVEWFQDDPGSATQFGNYVTFHVLAPLSSVFCYFADDLQPRVHNLPIKALAQISIVVETKPKKYNSQRTLKNLQDQLLRQMLQKKAHTSPDDAM